MKLLQGDCLELMKEIPDGSIDMILQDPPYNTTACKWEWDIMTKIDQFWAEWKRIIKPNGAIVMTASQPFTTRLIASNYKNFKYELIWEKTNAVDFSMAKKRPRKMHENILIFCKGQHTYNPQMSQGKPYIDKPRKRSNNIHASTMPKLGIVNNGSRYPSSVQKISNGNNKNKHPTQKPVALMEYLIRTYTNEGDTVFDGFAGSGTTGIACLNTDRHFIGMELDETYFNVAKARIEKHQLDIQPNSA